MDNNINKAGAETEESHSFNLLCQQILEKNNKSEKLHELIKESQKMEAAGNIKALQNGLSQLPDTFFINSTWLAYYQAVCFRFNKKPMVLEQLEMVFQRFEVEGDIKGQYKTWFAIAESIALTFEDLTPLKLWIKKYQSLKKRHPHCPSLELKLKVYALTAAVMSLVQPSHPRLKKIVTICQLGYPLIPFKEPRAAILTYLSFYYLSSGKIARLNALSKHMAPVMADRSMHMQIRLLAHAMVGIHSMILGEESAPQILDKGLALAQPGDAFYSTVHAFRIYTDLMSNNIAGAKKQLQLFSNNMPTRQRMDVSHFDFMSAWLSALESKNTLALEQSRLSKRSYKIMGFDFAAALCINLSAQLLVLQDDFDAAQAELKELSFLAKNDNSHLYKVLHDFSNAWLMLKRDGEKIALMTIVSAFKEAEKEGILGFPGFLHNIMSELIYTLISHKKSNDFVEKIIRCWDLNPPSGQINLKDWPWKVRIHTFGDFTVEVDGKYIDQNSRANQRSMDFLKLLVSFGGKNVSKDKMFQYLWPESEGDKASHAFDNLLHRTRKLIGSNVLTITAGRVSFNSDSCWLDIYSIKPTPFNSLIDSSDVTESIQQLLSVYKGSFLSDIAHSWAINARERHCRQFLEKVAQFVSFLVFHKRQNEAISLLQQAIDREPFHEALYFQLTQVFSELGSYSDAKYTYRRCQQMLETTYNTSPSLAFIALAEENAL